MQSVLLAGLILLAPAQGAGPDISVAAPSGLPAQVQRALDQAGVAAGNSAFVVTPLDGGALQLALHEKMPMNPASTMKLVTTYAALATLGPDFRWRTQAFASRAPVAGRLDGDLIFRGGGDPSLVIERWWLLIQRIRALGIRDIRGDLVVDRSAYENNVEAGATIDGNDLRPYNVAPDALLINFKALSLEFVPDPTAGVARIVPTPVLDGVHLPTQVPLVAGACGDWKTRLRADFSQAHKPLLHGSYAASCGMQTWHVSLLSPDEYALASFRALWRASGGSFHGGVRRGLVPAKAIALATQESPPLAQVIRDINKNSNNVMARQLFLTLGAATAGSQGSGPDPAAVNDDDAVASAAQNQPTAPANTERSIHAVQAWLQQVGLPTPELVLQNGSGLSRQERISAGSLAQLLVHAWNSADMPNFLASLPLAGVDGTMKKRSGAAHAAYIKTGYLTEVRAVAGYVFAASGHRYAVVALINDPNAAGAQAAHDEFLQWVRERG